MPDGIDSAWPTRIPQGWIQFGDGSWGPPNPTSPIDQAWPTRTVPGFGTGDPSGVTGYNNNVGFGGGQVGQYAPAPPDLSPPGTTLNGAPEPEILSPQQYSNKGSGREVGRWTNPFTDAHINPQTGQPEFVGGPGATIGPGSPAASGGGFPGVSLPWWARGGILGAIGAMTPTPAETGEFHGIGRPETGPENVGNIVPQYGMPFPQDSGAPRSQASPKGSAPKGSAPRAAPKGGRIDPATVNLGAGSPFTMIDRPNASPTGWNPGAPKTTALDLSRLFGGGQPAAAPPGPLANVPAAGARPVSATRVNLPANYNLPGSGYYMTPSGDVRGTRYPSSPAGAPPTSAAYQQWLRSQGVRRQA